MSGTTTSLKLLEGLRQADDQTAWQRFCARYEPMLLAFARRVGLQPEDARDVVQETLLVFVKRFRAGDYDRERGRLHAWLGGIAFNKIRDARRRLARREAQMPDSTGTTAFVNHIPDQTELTDIFDQEWRRAVLAECLQAVQQQVSPQTYEAFRLYALDGVPAEQVAEQLGIPRETVYVYKCRVLSHLRKLQEEFTRSW